MAASAPVDSVVGHAPVLASSPTLAVGILTKNEAARIARCIRSAAFADHVVVVDSGSTDDTVAIAQSLGAEVQLHADWKGFAEQRNRLLTYVQGFDYILFLDADEEIPAAMADEIRAAVTSGRDAVWRVRLVNVAFGRAMPRMHVGQGTQRMFKTRQLLRFEGVVHEEAQMRPPDLPRVFFSHKLLHYTRETVHDSLHKLTQYTMLGAQKRRHKSRSSGVLRGLASGAGTFFKYYVLRMGFLYGAEGFLYCHFIAQESFLRYAALRYDPLPVEAVGRD